MEIFLNNANCMGKSVSKYKAESICVYRNAKTMAQDFPMLINVGSHHKIIKLQIIKALHPIVIVGQIK